MKINRRMSGVVEAKNIELPNYDAKVYMIRQHGIKEKGWDWWQAVYESDGLTIHSQELPTFDSAIRSIENYFDCLNIPGIPERR